MNTFAGQKRSFNTVFVILLISIFLDKFLIAKEIPEASNLVGINPMVVFLDIPVDLPLSCGLIPVFGIFILFYAILILPYRSLFDGSAWQQVRKRLWAVAVGVLAIPFFMLSGGLIYLLAHDRLPKNIRNAIESFGINADIYTSYPGNERIRLKGSMLLLAGFLIGVIILRRKMRIAIPAATRTIPADDFIPSSVEEVPGRQEQPGLPAGKLAYSAPGPDRKGQLVCRLTDPDPKGQLVYRAPDPDRKGQLAYGAPGPDQKRQLAAKLKGVPHAKLH